MGCSAGARGYQMVITLRALEVTQTLASKPAPSFTSPGLPLGPPHPC